MFADQQSVDRHYGIKPDGDPKDVPDRLSSDPPAPAMPPVPARLAKFPLWKGKFPVHYTVWTNPAGEPDFKVMHERRREECFAKNLCHLCGETLGGKGTKSKGFRGGEYAFIGGPKCVSGHRFIDGPMHVECAEYAARACPYLANPFYKGFIHEVVRPGSGPNPFASAVHKRTEKKIHTRPEKMALVVADFYRVERNRVKHAFPGGSHAADPTAFGQLTAVPGRYLRIDWNIMPQATEPF